MVADDGRRRLLGLVLEAGLLAHVDAQAIGAEYKGRKVCSLGDAGIVSFYPTKNLGAAGDGGMVFSGDKELIDEIRVLRFHGERIRYFHDTLGTNSRLDAVQRCPVE